MHCDDSFLVTEVVLGLNLELKSKRENPMSNKNKLGSWSLIDDLLDLFI